MPKKTVDQNFDLGPHFGDMPQTAQNGPKFENRTAPPAYELGLCNYYNVLSYKPCPKTLLERNIDLGPHLGTMGPPNRQKVKFVVYGRRSFKFSGFTIYYPTK